jgi:hypothetical protein
MPTEVLRKPQPPLQGEDVERLFETCRRSEIGAIKAWYASEFDTRLTEISEVLRTEIAAQLRAQFVLELEKRVTSLRNEYEERQGTPVLIEEIAAVQERLDKVEVELDNRLTDDSFPLGAILRIRGEKLELSSYLRGLAFAAKAVGNRG